MEGVGARLGRSSTRYGPATVFTGPVRKWKKRWVPLGSTSGGSSNSHPHHHHHHHHQHSTFSSPSNGSSSFSNGHSSNGANGSSSHLLLYKWTPLGPNGSNGLEKESSTPSKLDSKNGGGSDRDVEDTDEPPKRKFKYMPVCLLENERNDPAEKESSVGMDEEEQNPVATDTLEANKESKPDSLAEKPDINNVPSDQPQGDGQGIRQDLNERLDLSLGLNSHDVDSELKPDAQYLHQENNSRGRNWPK